VVVTAHVIGEGYSHHITGGIHGISYYNVMQMAKSQVKSKVKSLAVRAKPNSEPSDN
jgi:enoyl-[acyl-carrier-protein] reductase (NADH)